MDKINKSGTRRDATIEEILANKNHKDNARQFAKEVIHVESLSQFLFGVNPVDKLKNSVGITKIGMKAYDIEEDGKDKRKCHQHKSKGQS